MKLSESTASTNAPEFSCPCVNKQYCPYEEPEMKTLDARQRRVAEGSLHYTSALISYNVRSVGMAFRAEVERVIRAVSG